MLRAVIPLIVLLLSTCCCKAQLTPAEKTEVINAFCKTLQRKYVFPETAEKITEKLNKNLASGAYDTIQSRPGFAERITGDTREIAGDLHLKISFDEDRPPEKRDTTRKDNPNNRFENILKENRYGIKSKLVLPGNIGYLEIPLFGPIAKCADTLVAAMDFVAGTDALILDLRSCRGALDENTVLFFQSYFFEEPQHLSEVHVPEERSVRQNWTYAWVPGKRYLHKPVYILTSSRTFSGGEAFAYDMQQFKRAVIVGETTRGGAHPTELVRLTPHFTAGIPYARPVSTVSKTNWEHTGVTPDSGVRANLSAYTATAMALKKLAASAPNESEKKRFDAALDQLYRDKPVFRKVTFVLNGYPEAREVVVAGSFNYYSRTSLRLQKNGDHWQGSAEITPGPCNYTYIVDGQSITDPAQKATVEVDGRLQSLMIVK